MKTMGLFLFIAVLLSGCRYEYKDVSNTPEFQHLRNSTFALRQGMFISGVNLPPGYGEEIDVYLISPTNPTWSGRELISRDTLPAETLLTVDAIRCSTGMFFKKTEAVVIVQGYGAATNVPIVVNLDYLRATNYLIPTSTRPEKQVE